MGLVTSPSMPYPFIDLDMTKEDYMRLPKERLAELLVKMEEKFSQPIVNTPTIPTTSYEWVCDGTHCINPFRDCINCPVQTTGGIASPNTASGTSIGTLHGNTSATDGKEHNPSFTD